MSIIPANESRLYEIEEGSLNYNPAVVYLHSLKKSSQRVQKIALENIVSIVTEDFERDDDGDWTIYNFPWHKLNYAITTTIRTTLVATFSPATANRHLSALKRVLEEAWRLKLISNEEMARASDLKSVKETKEPSGRALSDEEINSVLKYCYKNGMIGIRDFAMIALMWQCGLRRSEVVGLNVRNIDFKSGRIEIKSGKGNKDRVVFIGGIVLSAVQRWCTYTGHKGNAPVFTNVRGKRTRLTEQAVYYRILNAGKAVELESFTPHDLRRTFITNMLAKGEDVIMVSKMAGHSDPATTKRYDRRGEDDMRRAAEGLELPFDLES